MNPILEVLLDCLERDLGAFRPMTEAEAVREANLAQAEEYSALSVRIAELFRLARPFLGQGSSSSQRRRFWLLGLRLTAKVLRLVPAVTISANAKEAR
jgi:hypothetical protein